MMTDLQFGIEMDRLKSCYGDKSYPDVRVASIFKWARKLDSQVFKAVVDRVIDENERAPLLPKLREAYSQVKNLFPVSKTQIQCDYCGGSGWYSPVQPGVATAWACRCAAGDLIPAYVGRWTGTLIRMYPKPHEILKHDVKEAISTTFKSIETKGAV